MQDVKHGGTPLHWAKSKEIIEALIDSGCSVDARNFVGKTALHVMVEHERLDCALALITRGADVDLCTNDGDTALHLAVAAGHVGLVRALVAFEADTSLLDGRDLTPWARAVRKAEETGVLDFKDREGILYALHAVGAHGSAVPTDKSGKEKDFKKHRDQLSPQHRRARALFDEMLAQKAKKVHKKKKIHGNGEDIPDGNIDRGRLLSLDGGGIKG